ncbi:THUMP domain-containing protein [Devosia sp.]|uniref:THUMP domain-containing class I SAM-dependent RNA methyltransferase n=1 Tax=Devosia sp. TaxID=1871048 RepID=UPI001ACCB6FC|nr:THUMP domain-containing protein [Devosia sp.]MBN9310607.1 class I SAM-dependent RNA methyltransferase [Devosia sp.]
MDTSSRHEIFLVVPPGLEAPLYAEAVERGFAGARIGEGGVTVEGPWDEAWRANLELRGASRVLVRIASFRAMHLAQLDKRARKLAWSEVLRADRPVQVEATCRRSKIYHSGAAAQRIATAIREELGAPIAADAQVVVKARIEDDLVTISVDTSGEMLHKRGHKEAVNRAPMRETLAALFLRQAGYDGSGPVFDPMCGSGTFVIEAAEMAAGLKPGRDRHFAFEQLANFDAAAWAAMRTAGANGVPVARFYGSDRDPGAIRMSRANAERAGVADWTSFAEADIADIVPPEGAPGLVIVNPPYGARIGERGAVTPLYRTLGRSLARFSGWRVALITTEAGLARATGLPFAAPYPPVSHGGIRVSLFVTPPLK